MHSYGWLSLFLWNFAWAISESRTQTRNLINQNFIGFVINYFYDFYCQLCLEVLCNCREITPCGFNDRFCRTSKFIGVSSPPMINTLFIHSAEHISAFILQDIFQCKFYIGLFHSYSWLGKWRSTFSESIKMLPYLKLQRPYQHFASALSHSSSTISSNSTFFTNCITVFANSRSQWTTTHLRLFSPLFHRKIENKTCGLLMFIITIARIANTKVIAPHRTATN